MAPNHDDQIHNLDMASLMLMEGMVLPEFVAPPLMRITMGLAAMVAAIVAAHHDHITHSEFWVWGCLSLHPCFQVFSCHGLLHRPDQIQMRVLLGVKDTLLNSHAWLLLLGL